MSKYLLDIIKDDMTEQDFQAKLIKQYEAQGWLREALLKLVELEDRTLEGMSSGAPTAEEWRKAFDDARYVIDITRP